MNFRIKPLPFATKSTLKIKFALIIVMLCTPQVFESNTWAKVYQSDTPVGSCTGTNDFSSGSGAVSEKRKELEKECEQYDNKQKECERKKNCNWMPAPQVCEAIQEGLARSAEVENFCDGISSKEECIKHSRKCEWGYKAPSCNALNQTNSEDVEFCGKFDGTSEGQCEKHSKCRWD